MKEATVIDQIPRFLDAARAARRRAGWFRFFVPLDGMAVALEFKVEPSAQISQFRVSGQQSEALDEKPRLKEMLMEAAKNRLAMVNLLLEEFDMPWEALRTFKTGPGAVCAIIEAADERWCQVIREKRDANFDCA